MSRARVRARGRKKERALGSSILFRLYERVDGWVVVEWTKEVLWFCWFGKVATSLFLTGKNPILLEFWFKIQIGSRPFFFMKCFLCDGRMVVVVVVDKKVLWFCSKFWWVTYVYYSSGYLLPACLSQIFDEDYQHALPHDDFYISIYNGYNIPCSWIEKKE